MDMSHITYIKKIKIFGKIKVLVTGYTIKGSWLVIIMKFLGASLWFISKTEQNSLFKIANLKNMLIQVLAT